MAAAERVGRHLIVFHNRRWDSDYRTLRTVLDGGTLGTVHRFETSMERWRPQGKGGWRESAAPGDLGGLRYDLGPHLVDQALQLFGPVNEVSARVQSLREVASPDDDVLAVLAHDTSEDLSTRPIAYLAGRVEALVERQRPIVDAAVSAAKASFDAAASSAKEELDGHYERQVTR
jgi:predicted dehydrogenase